MKLYHGIAGMVTIFMMLSAWGIHWPVIAVASAELGFRLHVTGHLLFFEVLLLSVVSLNVYVMLLGTALGADWCRRNMV